MHGSPKRPPWYKCSCQLPHPAGTLLQSFEAHLPRCWKYTAQPVAHRRLPAAAVYRCRAQRPDARMALMPIKAHVGRTPPLPQPPSPHPPLRPPPPALRRPVVRPARAWSSPAGRRSADHAQTFRSKPAGRARPYGHACWCGCGCRGRCHGDDHHHCHHDARTGARASAPTGAGQDHPASAAPTARLQLGYGVWGLGFQGCSRHLDHHHDARAAGRQQPARGCPAACLGARRPLERGMMTPPRCTASLPLATDCS